MKDLDWQWFFSQQTLNCFTEITSRSTVRSSVILRSPLLGGLFIAFSCLAWKSKPTGRLEVCNLVCISPHSGSTASLYRGKRGQSQVGIHLAAHLPPVHHHPQLQQAPLGEVLHAHLRHRHAMDRCLLLPDGVAGEWREKGWTVQTAPSRHVPEVGELGSRVSTGPAGSPSATHLP